MDISLVKVSLNFGQEKIAVGKLRYKNQERTFEYDEDFIKTGLEISPFHLELSNELTFYKRGEFDGLPAVFHNSLPDGWGQKLLEHSLQAQGLSTSLSALERLSYVGNNGIGALIYEPGNNKNYTQQKIQLNVLDKSMQKVLTGDADEGIAELQMFSGTIGGARPKSFIDVSLDKKEIYTTQTDQESELEHWIIKFAGTHDDEYYGAMEYVYSLMAKEAGIEMTDTYLFHQKEGAGFFATKRFDWIKEKDKTNRVHVLSASCLLNTDFSDMAISYKQLLKATLSITKDVREVEKLYRYCVFNVLANNKDDHGKNFSYIMDAKGQWTLSPAYDLVFSTGQNGYHCTIILGAERYPTKEHLLKLASEVGVDSKKALLFIERTQDALSKWQKLATEYGVSKQIIKFIGDAINRNTKS